MGRHHAYVRKDERTYPERAELPNIVGGKDSFLSGWGAAREGLSVAAWACRDEDLDRVFAWVKARGDIKRPRVYRERGTWDVTLARSFTAGRVAHFHIYAVRPGHPALMGSMDPGVQPRAAR